MRRYALYRGPVLVPSVSSFFNKHHKCKCSTLLLFLSSRNDDHHEEVMLGLLPMRTISLPLDLPVIDKVSVLLFGPVRPSMETCMCLAGPPCFQMMFHTVRVDLSEWGNVPRE